MVVADSGAKLAAARRNRNWSQVVLARKVGITQARLSQIEAGRSTGVPTELWFALGRALEIKFQAGYGRDPKEELEDSGHLEMQELMLGLARQSGRMRTFELSTRPSNPAYSVDVGVRDDGQRVLILEECWNRFSNIGASVRSTRRKLAEAEELAVASGGEAGPYRVAGVWIVRDTARNREVLERYPEVFAATFAGDSAAWARALTKSDAPVPRAAGLVMGDPRGGRLMPWRRAR
jgi:transcriptional regulator with XRE-family HTH domain